NSRTPNNSPSPPSRIRTGSAIALSTCALRPVNSPCSSVMWFHRSSVKRIAIPFLDVAVSIRFLIVWPGCASVQYHPEAAPGPHDAEHYFQRFIELMEERHPNHEVSA